MGGRMDLHPRVQVSPISIIVAVEGVSGPPPQHSLSKSPINVQIRVVCHHHVPHPILPDVGTTCLLKMSE